MLILLPRRCWLLWSFPIFEFCYFTIGAFLVGVCGPGITSDLIFGWFPVDGFALRNRLEVLVIVLREEGNVAHFKGARLPLGCVLVAFDLHILGAGRRQKGVPARGTQQRH